MKYPRILIVFLDGVGIGKNDPSINPYCSAKLPTISTMLGGNIPFIHSKNFFLNGVGFTKLNATLGVKGLPQSGTGQTALLCGINASKLIGKHFGPYPYSSLREVIKGENIFIKFINNGKNVFYANAYPPKYFEYIEKHKTRRTATTLAYTMSGLELNDYHALQSKQAVSADITNEQWNAMGFPRVPVVTPYQAGKYLVNYLENHDLVFYEYFYTDHAGHSQSMTKCKEELTKIDELLSGILVDFDKKSMLLIVTSDHGNIEDLSTKSHTRNPVPLFLVGEKIKHFNAIKNITEITPAIMQLVT
jgi:2,3-bisphosphoglycerate-independent phosphoglycerate mutase